MDPQLAMFTTSNGIQFDLSGLYGKDVDRMPARDFAAALFRFNAFVAWRHFHPANLMQITAHLRNIQNVAASTSKRKGKNTSNSAWTFVYKLADQTLPAVPSPELVLMSSHSPRLTFQLNGITYRVPRIDGRMFRQQDLDIDQFIKILSSDNPGSPVGSNVVQEALCEFARAGFPAAPHPALAQRFLELYRPQQQGFPKQELFQTKNQKPAQAGFPAAVSYAQRFLNLKGPQQQGLPKRDSSRLKQQELQKLQSSTPSTLSGLLSIQTLPTQGTRESPQRFRESDRAALTSEGCALSVIPRMDPAAALKDLKSRIYSHVLRVGANGLVYATWYSNVIELVLVYAGSNLREQALQALHGQHREIQRVDRLGPVSPRKYMTWSVKMHHGERLEDVSTAMSSYFAGSGYVSRCILSPPSNSDTKLKTVITFEHAPPYLSTKLLWPDGLTMTRIVSKLTDINPFPSTSAGQPVDSPYPALGVKNMNGAGQALNQSEHVPASGPGFHASPLSGSSAEASDTDHDEDSEDEPVEGVGGLRGGYLQQNTVNPFGKGPTAPSMSSTVEPAPLVRSRDASVTDLLGFQTSAPLGLKRKLTPSPPPAHNDKKQRLFPFDPPTSITPTFATRPIPMPAFGKPSFPVPALSPWQIQPVQPSPPTQSNGFTAPAVEKEEEKDETQVDDFLDLLEEYVDAQLAKGKTGVGM